MREEAKGERVQKVLAAAGVASRRASEELILTGRVTLDGREVALGDRCSPGDDLRVDGVPVEPGGPRCYFLLNKPPGVLSTVDDPQGRPTVLDFLPHDVRGAGRLFPVGRLDMESSGLILLTNDGFLANRLLHPSYEVPREYMVEVEPVPSPADLRRLRQGVELDDGETGPAKASLVGSHGGRAQVRMNIHTGRKRQIRRTFTHLGYKVVRLSRVRFATLGLGSLPEGSARELDEREVRGLYRATGIEG